MVNTEDIPQDKVDLFSLIVDNQYYIVFLAKSQNTDVAYGSGNYQYIKLNRDGGTYYLYLYGQTTSVAAYLINDATLEFGDTSITFKSNIGLTLTIAKSGDFADFDGVSTEIYMITLLENNKLKFRYQAIGVAPQSN